MFYSIFLIDEITRFMHDNSSLSRLATLFIVKTSSYDKIAFLPDNRSIEYLTFLHLVLLPWLLMKIKKTIKN